MKMKKIEEEEICDGCYEPIDYCTCDDDELDEDSEMAEDWPEEY